MRANLPELRASIDGNDAHRCVHLLPRVRGLRGVAAAEAGRLLRVLFLRLGSLSPNPGQLVMLRDAGQPIGTGSSRVEGRADWASGLRGCLTWGVPIAILLATPSVGERYLVIVWPTLLTFMSVACWLNARRCGRIHCYATGPFFLLLAGLALLYGIGVLPLGAHGWSTLSAVLTIGTVVLFCVPEWLFGRYRSSRPRI
jgi:hypothetical protein